MHVHVCVCVYVCVCVKYLDRTQERVLEQGSDTEACTSHAEKHTCICVSKCVIFFKVYTYIYVCVCVYVCVYVCVKYLDRTQERVLGKGIRRSDTEACTLHAEKLSRPFQIRAGNGRRMRKMEK